MGSVRRAAGTSPTSNPKVRPEKAARVAELAAMTRPELLAECDRILAAYLTDPEAKAEARSTAGSDPNPDRIPPPFDVADFRSGWKRAVGQISTGG